MLRRLNLLSGGVVQRGGPRPWKNHDVVIVTHPADRPRATPDVDFATLNLKFPITHKYGNDAKHGWVKPPAARPDLPFFVERTGSAAALPVYTEFKAGRTKVVTILRKIGGDVASLKADLEVVCGGEPAIVRPGKLVVNGNYSLRVKRWLLGLGF